MSELPHHIPDEFIVIWKDLPVQELINRLSKLKENASRLSGDSADRMNRITKDLEAYIRYRHGDEATGDLDVFV